MAFVVTASPPPPPTGVHLDRTDENAAEIDALASLVGGRVGLGGAARRPQPRGPSLARVPRPGGRPGLDLGPRRPARRARWWPQGIATSADAGGPTTSRRRVVAVDVVRQGRRRRAAHGSRVTFLDLDTLRYRHVLLVVPALVDGRPVLTPLRVHAGGIVWCGPYLHVAATARGFITCRVDDVMRIPDERGAPHHLSRLAVDDEAVASYGYRYVLPVRFPTAPTPTTESPGCATPSSPWTAAHPPALVAGEYGRGEQTTRLARFPLDLDTALLETGDDDRARPVELDQGVPGMQGAVVVDGRWYVTVSHGPAVPGTVYVGTPGRLRPRRLALPMGPEDIAAEPGTDRLWTLTEHPGRRWVLALRRSRLG